MSTVVEILSAAHLSYYVRSAEPARGGIMFVAPPASLKTALVELVDQYPNAALISDLTVKSGARLRESLISGKIITLAFTDFGKVYQRGKDGASNIQGFLQGLTAEGFRGMNWEDREMTIRPARALVLGCMTTSFYAQKFSEWKDAGFARRFLWSCFSLYDSRAILEALIRNTRLQFSRNGFSLRVPTNREGIPYSASEQEARQIERLLRFQIGPEIGLTTMCKMLSALKWKHPNEPELPMAILKDFAESLSKEGAELHLDNMQRTSVSRAASRNPGEGNASEQGAIAAAEQRQSASTHPNGTATRAGAARRAKKGEQ